MDQVSSKYTNIYNSKALQNLPKFGIFGLKTNHLAKAGWQNNCREILKINNYFVKKQVL
jgi:hypothetical protein